MNAARRAGLGLASPASLPNAHAATGKRDRSEDRHELERDVPGDHVAPESREQVREREVEGEERKAVVPSGVPTRQVEMRKKVGAQERRDRNVRSGVARRSWSSW